MLFLSIFAIRAPVAVVYEGGGVYFGGASSKLPCIEPLSRVTVVAGTESSLGRVVLRTVRSARGSGYRCGVCALLTDGRYSS